MTHVYVILPDISPPELARPIKKKAAALARLMKKVGIRTDVAYQTDAPITGWVAQRFKRAGTARCVRRLHTPLSPLAILPTSETYFCVMPHLSLPPACHGLAIVPWSAIVVHEQQVTCFVSL